MNKEAKLELFKKEFPYFLQKVYDYNQNMICFGKIDDINHIQMCREFYEKHKEVFPENETNNDFWNWFEEITRCHVSLYRSWHPNERGIRMSPMFVQKVILK